MRWCVPVVSPWGRRLRAAGLMVVMIAGLSLAACGDPAGTPCAFTGGGFSLSHDCATKCLALWSVNCPDGSSVMPGVCAGRRGCEPGSCPEGQSCYHFDDPFEERSYCVPNSVCGGLTSHTTRRQWEEDSAAKASQVRREMEFKRSRRSGVGKFPAEPLDKLQPTTGE